MVGVDHDPSCLTFVTNKVIKPLLPQLRAVRKGKHEIPLALRQDEVIVRGVIPDRILEIIDTELACQRRHVSHKYHRDAGAYMTYTTPWHQDQTLWPRVWQ